MKAAKDTFIGTWELDLDSLDYRSGRPGRWAVYKTEALPDGLMFSFDSDDADGRSIQFQYGGSLDGTPLPLPVRDGTPQHVLRRDGPRLMEIAISRGEQVADRWTLEIARDGQRITLIQYVRRPEGRELNNRTMYRRTKRLTCGNSPSTAR